VSTDCIFVCVHRLYICVCPQIVYLCVSTDCIFVCVHRFDLKKKEITVEVLVPKAHFEGKYETSGKIMSLPIIGKGDFEATFGESTQLLLTASITAPFFEWASLKTTIILMLFFNAHGSVHRKNILMYRMSNLKVDLF